jgi:hypothetical protein
MHDGPVPPGRFAIICAHTARMQEPILQVVRDAPLDDEDSGWVFSCRRDDHTDPEWLVVLPNRYFAADPTLQQLLEMPEGYVAERPDRGHPWVIQPREVPEE